jgi:hypothetical protein
VGYADGNEARANQYRVLGRSGTGVAWPDDEADPFESATQRADPWVDMTALYPGIRLEPENGGIVPRFELTFNSRGAASMTNDCFDPFQVHDADGEARSLRVSVIGSVRAE